MITTKIASAGKKTAYNKNSEDREWVTIVETISATGEKVKPLVIFKGKRVQSTWFQSENVPDWRYTASDKGWTSYDIAIRWLKHIFDVETKPVGSTYRMLILDGHGSHVNIDFMWECYQRRIVLLFLPAHTSHVLQPLDVACFSQVKLNYRFTINDLSQLDDAAPVKKERSIHAYSEAREIGLSKKVILGGWKGSGIHPLNVQKVQQSSQVSGRPTTPTSNKKIQQLIDRSIATPKSPQELLSVYRQLLHTEQVSKSVRIMLSKASRAIGKANTQQVMLEITNKKLQLELSKHVKPRTRKRVQVDPNDKFSRVELISQAQVKSRTDDAKKARIAAVQAACDKANGGKEPYLMYCNEFQL